MAYHITYTSPRYDNLDRCVGSSTSRCEELGTFETLAWAMTKAWLLDQECGGEIIFQVRNEQGLLAREEVVAAPAFMWDDGMDDIPF